MVAGGGGPQGACYFGGQILLFIPYTCLGRLLSGDPASRGPGIPQVQQLENGGHGGRGPNGGCGATKKILMFLILGVQPVSSTHILNIILPDSQRYYFKIRIILHFSPHF